MMATPVQKFDPARAGERGPESYRPGRVGCMPRAHGVIERSELHLGYVDGLQIDRRFDGATLTGEAVITLHT
jgi:hypothetical protein